MLSVRVTAAAGISRRIQDHLRDDPTVCDLVVLPAAAMDGKGDLLLFEMTKENANSVMRMMRNAGVADEGAIVVTDPLLVVSAEADEAERTVPGNPDDGVLWMQADATSRQNSRMSGTFLVFLLLATLIASVGRLQDQPILIIGAMVVGPEFAPLAAICLALVRRRKGIILPAIGTLFGGFALCALIAWGLWAVVYAFGGFSYEDATSGPLTDFIISPDIWSFVIALLAGVAGVLSVTTAKSSALVGVFISVTTVPAVGALSLALAVGAWPEAGSSILQLVLNLAGLFIAGTITLFVQLRLSRWIGLRAARLRRRVRRIDWLP
ncbi:DUF389 domain-containing protein [Microbacterium sp. NPDC057650]|uniref:DUF389 domain-containing protein n=1 Tax=unclassified Microbacterium TaxID=2609290 RepID=UPI00366F2D6D